MPLVLLFSGGGERRGASSLAMTFGDRRVIKSSISQCQWEGQAYFWLDLMRSHVTLPLEVSIKDGNLRFFKNKYSETVSHMMNVKQTWQSCRQYSVL